ncbi:MAG: hypothetical protein JWM27_582, partial [Gemmatimonadetes bacterium]|nr:hypothetical protein [Gemmatimonadota bacterium]
MRAAAPLPRRKTAEPERSLPPTRTLVGWTLLGGFALGYLVVWLLFFPGFARNAIVTVPDVRGRTFAQAKGDAEDEGLTVAKGTTLSNPYVPAGHVLAQQPLPGQEVTRGAVVHLILSSGPVRRHVPDLAGLDADEATALLARFGFAVAVTAVTSPEYEGKILAALPASGAEVPLPATVRLTVSAGPPKQPAPDVLGLTLGEVQSKLDSAGLRLGRIGYDSASTAVLGNIVGQRPAPGDSVRQGGSVSVTLSGIAPPPAVAPDSAAPATDGQPPAPGAPADAVPQAPPHPAPAAAAPAP